MQAAEPKNPTQALLDDADGYLNSSPEDAEMRALPQLNGADVASHLQVMLGQSRMPLAICALSMAVAASLSACLPCETSAKRLQTALSQGGICHHA